LDADQSFHVLTCAARAKAREFVFGARDRIDDTPDRVRTVRDGRFKLVRNFEPARPYLQPMAYAEISNPTYNRMRRLHAEGKLNADQRKFMAAQRAPEELYDLQADPFELNNLAADPRHRATLDRLRAVFAAWLADTRDESAAPEEQAELDAQLKNLEKIVAGHRQKLGPTGRLEAVPGAPDRKN
jgi:arylsulfatase A-like enzyme